MVKSEAENPARVSMHNFNKMQWMENNKSGVVQLNWTTPSQKSFFQGQNISRFEKTGFELTVTEIKFQHLKINNKRSNFLTEF